MGTGSGRRREGDWASPESPYGLLSVAGYFALSIIRCLLPEAADILDR